MEKGKKKKEWKCIHFAWLGWNFHFFLEIIIKFSVCFFLSVSSVFLATNRRLRNLGLFSISVSRENSCALASNASI